MTSWKRYKAYAYQNGQNPYREVIFTAKQGRRYTKKWKREFGDDAWKRHLVELDD